mgnify:CR=1 FL=1
MKVEWTLKEQRATIFIAPIQYNVKNLAKVKEAISNDNYLPYVMSNVPIISFNNPGIMPNIDWVMTNDGEQKQIHFTPQKIDFISTKEDETPETFCKEACDFFSRLIELFGSKVRRLAYAPKYSTPASAPVVDGLNEAIFKNNVFENRPLRNIDVRQNYRLSESLADKNYDLNYIANLSVVQEIVSEPGKTILNTRLENLFDINTVQDNAKVFTGDEVKSFFTQSPLFAAKFLNNYNNV